MTDPTSALFDAVSFAARAHRHQVRKDGTTPYAAHVFRVALVASHVFRVADPKVLTAAVLHDTIEDTPTDYDDLLERFGLDVAGWVAALTKDMRTPEESREAAYLAALVAAPWPVCVCKLADIYDNIGDVTALDPAAKRRTAARSREYLEALRPSVPPEAAEAFALTERRLERLEATLG